LIPPPPTPGELPANIVAIVSHVPDRLGRITKAEFQHALAQAAAAIGRRRAPKPGGHGYGTLAETALGELLDTSWIGGQAAEMGIGVTAKGVSRELARLKRRAFKSEAEYRRFLKEARYTRWDVRQRVEVQMLSTRIQERIAVGLRGKSRQKAFAKFVAEYTRTWKARTVCAPDYVIPRCSNSPVP
jgi:hypothetical protein